ncbi:MAG: HAD-IA family hydrolase [Eubacterium sp.]|nr:HAD-IA family hydrolase [Eubacterium sp.]
MSNYMTPQSLDEIEELFCDESVKVISFDMFDTLVTRSVERAGDVFRLLDRFYAESGDNVSGFEKIRTQAESFLRRQITADTSEDKTEDITLDDIYDTLEDQFSVDRSVADHLKQKEFELEMKLSEPRRSGKRLWEKALKSGKKVIVTSDMYLTGSNLAAILEKNGYGTDIRIYVSSDIGKRKLTGNLYKYILNDMDIDASEMIHIGDNPENDCRVAGEMGIRAVYLPSALDIFKKHGCSTQVQKICADLTDWEKASSSVGIGIARQMSANLYFDDPFRRFNDTSDYNADSYFVGFAALGNEVLSLVRWLSDSVKRDGLKKLVFLSRDGYLPKMVYDRYRVYHPELPESGYIYTSRLSLLPALLKSPADFFNLPTDLNYQTPEKLLGLLSFCDGKEGESLSSDKHGFKEDDILDRAGYHKFIRFFLDNRYNKDKHDEAVKRIKTYLTEKSGVDFSDKVGIFDMGYSGRIPAAIYSVTGEKPCVYFFHTDPSDHSEYEKRFGFSIRTFFDFNPYMESSLREYSYLEVAPSCTGYDNNGDPVFDVGPAEGYANAALKMQQGALDFVDKYLEYFGDFEAESRCRCHDGAMTYEAFIRYTSDADKKIYDGVLIDDELWGGRRDIDLKYLMNTRLGKIPGYAGGKKCVKPTDGLNVEDYSELRSSIVNWYDFRPGLDILTVESDTDIAELLASGKKYDYIVDTCGYGKRSVETNRLKDYRNLIKDEGTILFTVENRFGLKYFCGAADPYTGISYDGVNGYLKLSDSERQSDKRCYSRKEVCHMLSEAGFDTFKFFYPVPDSRMPQMIFTDDYQDGVNATERLIDYIYSDNAMIGVHHRILPEMIGSGALGFMADSFLVEATVSGELSDIKYAVPTSDRGKYAGMSTTIREDDRVIKRPLYKEGEECLRKLNNNMDTLRRRGVPVIETELGEDEIGLYISMPYIRYEGLSTALEGMSEEKILSVFDRLYEYINLASDRLPSGNLERAYIDIAPCNAFYDEEKDDILIYDQEFVMEDCPAEYAMYRTIRYAFQSIRNLRENYSVDKMYDRYGIDREMKEEFYNKEEQFIESVRKKSCYEELYKVAVPDYDSIYDRMLEFTRLNGGAHVSDAGNVPKKEKKKYKVGYVPGVFDLFHTGHLNLLTKCKSRCEHLIVGILTDELVEYYKGKRPIISYEGRAKVVEALKVVDEVIPVDFSNTDKLDAWNQLHYDCHFSGDDHVGHWNDIMEELRKRGSNMEFFPYTQGISSTQIRTEIGKGTVE